MRAESRIQKLERRNLALALAVVGTCGLCVVGVLMGQARTRPVKEVMRAQRVEVVGTDGEVLGVLSATEQGGALELNGPDGRPGLALMAGEDGGHITIVSADASKALDIEPPKRSRARLPHFKCLQCGDAFTATPGDIPRERLREAPDPSLALLDCPNGHERSSVGMGRCVNPDCEKWYVAQRTLYHILVYRDDLRPEVRSAANEMLDDLLEKTGQSLHEEPRDICPHCGTDRLEWLREHRGD